MSKSIERRAAMAAAALLVLGSPAFPVPGVAPGPDADAFRAAGVARLEPPRLAPNLSVVVAEGERRALPDLRGRPVMLWFFASW